MGSCCGHHSNIIHDPTVTAYASVGDMCIVNGPMSTLYEKGICRKALLYIDHDSLYYFESKCPRSLTSKYPFTDIRMVEVLRNEVINVSGKDILLNPGIQITVRGSNGLDTTISAAMPEADHFASELKKSLDEYRGNQ